VIEQEELELVAGVPEVQHGRVAVVGARAAGEQHEQRRMFHLPRSGGPNTAMKCVGVGDDSLLSTRPALVAAWIECAR